MNNRPPYYLLILGFVMLMLAAAIAGFVGWKYGRPGVSINASRAAVIKGVKEIGRLETASLTVEKVITAGTNGPAFQEILFGDRILMIAQGTVIAGVNLEGVTMENVRFENGELSLTLPPPQVLSVSLDNEQTRVYDRRTGFLTKGDPQLESRARYAAEMAILDAACEAGLMDKAGSSAQKQLTKLVEALNLVKDESGTPVKITEFKVIVPKTDCPKWRKPEGWKDNDQNADYEDLL